MDDNFIKQDIITADFRYDEGLRLRRGGGHQQLQQNVGADNGLAGKPLLLIKNNTKQGYLSASGGDGIYTNTSTKRGTVQKQMIPALTSFQDKGVVLNDLRIRKLTPKECWRLMGFDDTDFEKAEKVNSNAQLYKQAGNSIVVNVLEAILTNLFLKDENDFEGQINFDMLG
jgi:DNA (cytosine-5)-methyltransferase 1